MGAEGTINDEIFIQEIKFLVKKILSKLQKTKCI
jgi:hypothetical protein